MSAYLEIDVKCTSCNIDLNVDVRRGIIYVEACTRCLEKEKQEGYDEGFKEGEKGDNL
jgi:hypothetical protein